MLVEKHFKAIAEIFKDFNNTTSYDKRTIKTIAKIFAAWLKTQNPCFDRSKFMKACGLEE